MKILCGTDFSKPALEAANAAAALAVRARQELILAHVVDEAGRESLSQELRQSLLAPQRRLLHEEAERLRRRGARVQEKLLSGAPDEALAQFARKFGVQLIVIASLGRRRPVHWLLGSVSDRTVQNSPAPTLVVRSAASFAQKEWEARKLKIVVGVDFTVPSDAALRWLGEFVHLGACAVVAVHICSPARERERLGVSDTTEKNATEIRAILERDVRDRVNQTAGIEDYHVRIDLSRAKNDARLIEIAAEEQADLIVVGTHQRHGLDLVWPGSVSRAVLQNAPVSVVCVPVMADTPGSLACVPPVNCVLAATDFSPLGNLALPHACSLLGAGGVVRFLHVVHPQALPGGEFHQGPGTSSRHARLVRDAHRRLLALVPPDAAAHGLQVDVEIVEERSTARAICQAARRCGADVICLGTQGHTDLSNVLLGSVALAVLKATRRPVFLVRPPRA